MKRKRDEETAPTQGPAPTMPQLTGRVCCCCESSRSSKNCAIPPLRIGQYRTLKLCKKAHITNDDDCAMLNNLIDNEIRKIQRYGDSVVSQNTTTIQGSQDSEESEQQEKEKEKENNTYPCEGFRNLKHAGDTRGCNKKTNEVLRFTHTKKKKSKVVHERTFHFCKGSHLTRFLIHYYTKKGGKDGSGNLGSLLKSRPQSNK